MNNYANIFGAVEWGALLHTVTENSPLDITHGQLIASEANFEIKVLNPINSEELKLELGDIIKISSQILLKYPNGAVEIEKGLKHLEEKVKLSVDEHKYYGKSSNSEAIGFYLELEEFSEKINATPELQIKKQLIKLSNQDISADPIIQIKNLIKENKNLLFELTEAKESFFDLVRYKYPVEVLAQFLEEIFLDVTLDKKHVAQLNNFIFKEDLAENSSFFKKMMTGEKANTIFDIIIKDFTEVDINKELRRKWQILDFAHTSTRYEYIFLKSENLYTSTVKQADLCISEFSFSDTVKNKLSSKNSYQYKNWLAMRQQSSSSLILGDKAKVYAGNWNKAEDSRSSYVKRDKGSQGWFDWSNIQVLHLKMCRGEEGIENPGQLREGIVRTGGTWVNIYCPHQYLEENVEKFMGWFNKGLILCEEKKLNPIIFAAQTYQRLVSLHPFENGNGRISRMLMDYVLERFDLPPPVLGKDILDAVFPLDQPKKTQDQDQFIFKIITGIENSIKILK
ncbi:MAG: Fic family protein [Candidatus Protochlamydia sp.]|nr:Fic family protein [Candidatus Protochlamydia sp.]